MALSPEVIPNGHVGELRRQWIRQDGQTVGIDDREEHRVNTEAQRQRPTAMTENTGSFERPAIRSGGPPKDR